MGDLAGFFTKRRIAISLCLLSLVVLMSGLFRAVPGGFVPEEDQGYFLINIQLPDASSLRANRRRGHASRIDILEGIEGIESVTDGRWLQPADGIAGVQQPLYFRVAGTVGRTRSLRTST